MKRFAALLLALLLLCGCGVSKNPKTEDPSVSETAKIRDYYTKIKGNNADEFLLMLYVNAENNEEAVKQAFASFGDLALSGKLTVMIQVGGVLLEDAELPEGGGRYLLSKEGFFRLSSTEYLSNIKSPGRLSEFVEFSKAQGDYDRAALIFVGALPLDISKITTALSSEELDFIGFNGPFSCSVEDIGALSPVSDYLIADASPLLSLWDYASLFSLLDENSSLTTPSIAKELGSALLKNELYFASGYSPLLFCADMTLASRANLAAEELFSHLQRELLAGNLSDVSKARLSSGFGEYIPISDFCFYINNEDGEELMEAAGDMLSYAPGVLPLSIYFPLSSKNFSLHEKFLSSYYSLTDREAASQPWYNETIANSYADPAFTYDMSSLKLWYKEDGRYALALFEGDEERLAKAELYTLMDVGDYHLLLGKSEIREQDEAGDLSVAANGEWLFVNGQVVAHTSHTAGGSIYYRIEIRLNGEAAELLAASGSSYNQVTGAMRKVGDFYVYEEIVAGDVIEFLFDFYDKTTGAFIKQEAYGYKIAVAETLTLSTEAVREGDVILFAQVTDLFLNTGRTAKVNLLSSAAAH